MFERFTDAARAAVVRAQDEAHALNHHYVGTEHLLLGLLADPAAPAAALLASVGVRHADVRADVVRIIGRGGEEPESIDRAALAAIGIDLDEVRRRVEAAFGPGALDRSRRPGACAQLPFTPRSKKALEMALRHAVELHDREIHDEHLLLGLLRVEDGVAAEILAERRVTYAWLRRVLRDAS